jgi:small subunit ribosomal protein S1
LRVVGWARPSTTTQPNQDRLNQAPRNERVVAPPPVLGTVVNVTVDKIESFGVFVSWATGRGLVPSFELGVPHGADLRKLVPIGSQFDALVQDVRPDGKVRLSRAAAAAALERSEADAWMAQQKTASADAGVGSFGELLRAKLNQGKK